MRSLILSLENLSPDYSKLLFQLEHAIFVLPYAEYRSVSLRAPQIHGAPVKPDKANPYYGLGIPTLLRRWSLEDWRIEHAKFGTCNDTINLGLKNLTDSLGSLGSCNCSHRPWVIKKFTKEYLEEVYGDRVKLILHFIKEAAPNRLRVDCNNFNPRAVFDYSKELLQLEGFDIYRLSGRSDYSFHDLSMPGLISSLAKELCHAGWEVIA